MEYRTFNTIGVMNLLEQANKQKEVLSAMSIQEGLQHQIKQHIYEISMKIDEEIKGAALKGHKVLVMRKTNEIDIADGKRTARQKIGFYPMDSMEEAQEIFKGHEYSFYDLDLVREYLKAEYKKIGERWDGVK